MLPLNLPDPNLDAKLHSQALVGFLQTQIPLSFRDYMDMVLYHPKFGYYALGQKKFGEGGDFITGPELSDLFGGSLCESICCLNADLVKSNWLELGAGSGQLARQILLYLNEKGCLPEQYFILEISQDLKLRQKAYLKAQLPDFIFARIGWLSQLPKEFDGIIIGNEVLDAVAVERFKITANGVKQAYVDFSHEQGSLVWQWQTPMLTQFTARVEEIATQYHLSLDYESELHETQAALIKTLAEMLHSGLMLWIDYGYSAKEYYYPGRRQGTLQCYYQHRVHADPFFWPGLQDITAHVNFTAMAKAALESRLTLEAYVNQGAWFLAAGMLELAEKKWVNLSEYEKMQHQQALKKIVNPAAMGDLFKVMVLSKNIALDVAWCEAFDRRYEL